MRKIIMETQNNGKALEVRLEQASAGFQVVLAGMTYNLNTGCATGACGGDDDYMYIENETYMAENYPSFREAITAYHNFRKRYLDDPS